MTECEEEKRQAGFPRLSNYEQYMCFPQCIEPDNAIFRKLRYVQLTNYCSILVEPFYDS